MIKVTKVASPTSLGENLMINIYLEKAIQQYIDKNMVKEITKALSDHIIKELAPIVSQLLKNDIQTIVKDIGPEITVAGLKYLTRNKE